MDAPVKRALLLSLSLLIFPLTAEAFDMEEERHYRAAAELLGLLGMDKRAEKCVEAAVRDYLEANPDRKGHEEAVREFYGRYIGWEAVENDMLDLFTGEFSEKEIREMIEFYGTPTGKKAAAMINELYDEGVAAGRRKAEKNVRDLEEDFGVE